MISTSDRQNAVMLIDEAIASGARRRKACGVIGISARTYRRWTCEADIKTDARPSAQRPAPSNKLTEHERQQILDIANEPRFRNLPPSQIVPILADEGRYIASEASFYRVLKQADQLAHRSAAKAPAKRAKPEAFIADSANQVWSWDITYLASTIVGKFFRLYLVMDIFSRKIVGWEVHHDESAEHASQLIQKACLAESIRGKQIVLHSDNGSPMKGATMLATLQRLGVVPSFSRPAVSNDNPYSESLFRTIKYTPAYPSKPFDSIEQARQWVYDFVQWYNHQHRHSALKFVTPIQRHEEEEHAILARRKLVYENARASNPNRWSRKIRNWAPASAVELNPDKNTKTAASLERAA